MVRRRCFIMLLLGMTTFGQPVLGFESGQSETAIVKAMGSQTEALVDALIVRDQAAAEQHYQSLKTDLDRLHRLAANANFSERSIRELFMAYSWMRLIDIDMHEHAWTGAAIAANQMGGEIIRFTDFANLTLRDVAWMGYLSRDVMLLSMEDTQGNLQAIDLRRGELGETWKRVREELIKDFRNKTLVMHGDQIISSIQQADSDEKLIESSGVEHQFVDEIEKSLGLG